MASWDERIVRRRLAALYRELTEPPDMKIRITEDTFWLGKDRKVGDVLDNQVAGPFRTALDPNDGHLKRIPQFVEMPEEIKANPPQAVPQPPAVPPAAADAPTAAPAVVSEPKPAAGSFADAAAVVLKPVAPVAAKPAGNALAARVRALTTRQAKFQDVAAAILDEGEAAMTEVETHGPKTLTRLVESAQDQMAAITDLADALKEAGGNG